MDKLNFQDLYGDVFLGGGGKRKKSSRRKSRSSNRPSTGSNIVQVNGKNPNGAGSVIPYANRVAQAMDPEGSNPRDPQGTWGRPTFSEGDAYSGDMSYGSSDGR